MTSEHARGLTAADSLKRQNYTFLITTGAAEVVNGLLISQAVAVNLEQIPQELIVDIVVILHFRSFHERSQQPRTAIR